MTRQELLDALTAERYGIPVRSDRPRPVPGNLFAIVAEARPEEQPERLPIRCQYAACNRSAAEWVDGFALCLPHKRKHASEVAS
jgi:hypothetical protein